MPDTILTDTADAYSDGVRPESMPAGYWEAIYQDLLQKMTPTAADQALGVADRTVSNAIARGEIDPYQFSPKKQYVTPRLLAIWAETHCRCHHQPLVG